MRLTHCLILPLWALLLAACAGGEAPVPLLLRQVRAVNPDGTLSAPLAEKDLSPFQQLLRDRIPAPLAQSSSLFALEVDVPEGQGVEGDYLAILRTGATAELLYFEQSDHRPRFDRFFHRRMTAEETADFADFQKAHPLAQLRRMSPVPFMPAGSSDAAMVPATEPGAPPDEKAAATQPVEPDAASDDAPILFRFTDARPQEAQTIVIQSPGKDDHPVVDLLRLLARFRDAGPFTSTYVQQIPPTAQSLYADPYRRVLYVWHGGGGGEGDDLRIAVTSPLHPLDLPPEGPDEHWLAYKEGTWQPCAAPPGFGPEPEAVTEPATEPAVEPETAPATEPATQAAAPGTPAETEPVLVANPDMLSPVEMWWTEPNRNSTMVRHYIPLTPTSGVTLGFIVPAFEFDDDHCAVDAARGILYLIHDGQLFSLPIPPASLGVNSPRMNANEPQ